MGPDDLGPALPPFPPILPLPFPLGLWGGALKFLGGLPGTAPAPPDTGTGAGVGLVDPGFPTLAELIQDAYDGARVPVGFPLPPPIPDPAPFMAGALGGILDLIRAARDWWIPPGVRPEDWAALNSRPRRNAVLPEGVAVWPVGLWNPAGPNRWTFVVAGPWRNPSNPWVAVPSSRSVTYDGGAGVVAWLSAPSTNPGPGWVVFNDAFVNLGGSVGDPDSLGWSFLRTQNFEIGSTLTATVAPIGDRPGAVPFPPQPGGDLGEWTPAALRPATPASAPAISPAPRPRPAVAPTLPEGSPIGVPGTVAPATAPAPAALPATRPALTPLPAPAPAGAVTVTRGGVLPAPAARPVPTTAAGTKVLTRAGSPVRVVPVSVPATLSGIAAEVGRLETKMRLALEAPGAGGPELLDRLEGLGRLLEGIGATPGPDPAGRYELDSPCEVTEAGALKPPVEVDFPESAPGFPAVLKRLDALAELLQAHKNLRQPSCKQRRPTGDPVTVTFEAVG